jgi:hypothetical protein
MTNGYFEMTNGWYGFLLQTEIGLLTFGIIKKAE